MKSFRLSRVIVFLLVFCACGMVYSACAWISEGLYYRARYGADKGNPVRIAALCATAQRLHPCNHYFCVWAGKQAFYGRLDMDGVAAVELLVEARRWADEAFALNPRNSEAVHLQAELRAIESLDDAIALWEAYRDWHFWEPFNHWMLFDLTMRAGRLEQAEEPLYWLKDTEYFEKADAWLKREWTRRREAELSRVN